MIRRLITLFSLIAIIFLVICLVLGISPKEFLTGKSSDFDKDIAQAPYIGGVVMIQTKEGDHGFNVEIAKDLSSHSKGLMFRKEMPQNSGMLFIFDEPQELQFWMKNTYISLDILFIDEEDKIIHIASDTTPLSESYISSTKSVIKVLEINAGLAQKLDINVGDKVIYQLN